MTEEYEYKHRPVEGDGIGKCGALEDCHRTSNTMAMDFEDWFAQEISIPAAAVATSTVIDMKDTGGKTSKRKRGNSSGKSKNSNGHQNDDESAALALARKRAQNRRDNREYRRRKKAKVETLKQSVEHYNKANEHLKKENEELEKMLAVAKQRVSQRCGESVMASPSVDSMMPFHSPGPKIAQGQVVPPARVIRFAETAHLCVYEQDLDNDNEKDNSGHHEFWYTESECYAMKRAAIKDAVKVLSNTLAGAPFDYSGSKDDTSVCCVGIENLLASSSSRRLKVRECIDRCISAVLAEQAKQGSSDMDIALASFAQTRKVALRARKLGIFHQGSI